MNSTLPTLDGPRVRLRWLTAEDACALLDTWGDPEVMRFMARAPLGSVDESVEFIAGIHDGFRQGSLFQWGLEHRGRLAGTLTLAGIDTEHRRAEVGFALARDGWGQGLMREALGVLLARAFNEMGLHRIEADVDPRNAASIALLEGTGFVREGYLRQRYFVNSEVQDAVLYGLLVSDWRG